MKIPLTLSLFNLIYFNHYSSNELHLNYLSAEDLYSELGFDQKWMDDHPDFGNTCAVRMSLALIRSGVPINGKLHIEKGRYQGYSLEPGANALAIKLSNIFDHRQVLVANKKSIKSKILLEEIGPQKLKNEKGIVYFHHLNDRTVSHIDLIDSVSTLDVIKACHSDCYFNSKEVWFWPVH